MRAIKVSVIKPWCPNASFKASSERQKGRRWWGKGKIRHRNRDRKLLEGGGKILADNLCVIYLCVMLPKGTSAGLSWLNTKTLFSFHCGSSPVLHELFFPSPDFRSDFLSFQLKNKDVSKNSKVPAWQQIWLGSGKKTPFWFADSFPSSFLSPKDLSVQPFSLYLCFHTLAALSLFSKSLHNQVRLVVALLLSQMLRALFSGRRKEMI